MIEYKISELYEGDNLGKSCIILCITLILTLSLTGCTQPENTPAVLSETVQTPAVSVETEKSPTPAPSFTPIPTTPPETTPGESVSAQPTETPNDGRKTVADGFYYIKLNDSIKKRITGMSYPSDDKNIEISYDDLRYIRLKYYDFDGNVHDDGELIVNAALAKEVTEIFYTLYKEKYPLASVRLVDEYGEPGDDNLSMAANNTSGFNYRKVTGKKNLSQHSYGRAIDINPLMNPYIKKDGSISPPKGAEYADRSLKLRGMIDTDDPCYKLFTKKGWSWGGYSGEKDYQHFSKKAS
jgi:hypothetical protein